MKFPYQPHPQVLQYLPDFIQPALILNTYHCQLRPHNPKKHPLVVTYKLESVPQDTHLIFLYQLFFPTESRIH